MSTQNAVSHTPGPWTEYAPRVGGVIDPNYRYIESQGFTVSGFIGPADARLIAAAPDMLEALREAWDQFEQMEKMFRDDLEFMGALSAVRAAVAKAEAQS